MLIDLHCHTRPLSACSSLTVENLIDGALRAGLDGVCLTEHDRLWPVETVRELGAAHGLVVLRGMEITTELGHVLVFGLDQPPPLMFLAAKLAEAVERAGGIMTLAHPGRSGQPAVASGRISRLFHTIETINGSDGAAQNRAAAGFEPLMRLPGIGGSDCHARSEVGRAATLLPHAVRDEAELVAALHEGRHRAVLLGEGTGQGEAGRRITEG